MAGTVAYTDCKILYPFCIEGTLKIQADIVYLFFLLSDLEIKNLLGKKVTFAGKNHTMNIIEDNDAVNYTYSLFGNLLNYHPLKTGGLSLAKAY